MIQNALTGETSVHPKTLLQQKSDFTAEGAPPPEQVAQQGVQAANAADKTAPTKKTPAPEAAKVAGAAS